MRYLRVEEILVIHDYQIERFGGAQGILNLPLLESAINRPITNISNKDMYESIYEKAAVLAYSIIINHPFVDGNKRTGMHSALTFLELNGYEVTLSQKMVGQIALDVVNKKMDLDNITSVFKKYSTRR